MVDVNGRSLTPSVVHYAPNGEVTVGWPAKALQRIAPDRTIHAAKRLMGVKWADSETHRRESEELGLALDLSVDTGNVGIRIEGGPSRIVKPEEVGFAVLQELKRAAEELLQPWERALGMRLREVSISVPVSFSYVQRLATVRAGKMAGFSNVHLIEEPIAAAMAYGLHKKEKREGRGNEGERVNSTRDVLVVDIGGGTLDVALLYLDKSSRAFLIQSTAGLPHLGKIVLECFGRDLWTCFHVGVFIGGEDFDMQLADEILRIIEGEGGVDVFRQGRNRSGTRPPALLNCAEETKRCLSSSKECVVVVWQNATCSLKESQTTINAAMEIPVSRTRFDAIAEDLYAQVLQPVNAVLEEAGLKLDAPMDVVLVGGSSRIPRIRTLLREHLKYATLHYDLVDPDLAVALGTARSWSC